MCACAVGEFSVIDELDFRGREVNAWSAGLFKQRSFFWKAVFYLPRRYFESLHFSFVSFVWMQCTKCQECRKTYYCVVVQGMRWCFCFVSCHKWSILDVQFRVKPIESCSGGASMSGVDIFRGGSHSCDNLCGSKRLECVRAEEGFLASCEFCLHFVRHSFPIKWGQ